MYLCIVVIIYFFLDKSDLRSEVERKYVIFLFEYICILYKTMGNTKSELDLLKQENARLLAENTELRNECYDELVC